MTSAVLATTLNVNRVSGDPVALDAFVPKLDDEPVEEEKPDVITDPEEKREIGRLLRQRFGAAK